MRNLLRSRRGSAAFATVIALVPLIGVVALGAEAGSWYVTKQHAQNAADAAAISGAWSLVCSIYAQKGVPCTDTNPNPVDYRGKEFAAQNAFCNAGDTSYPGSRCVTPLPTGTTQTVQIDQPTASSVRAIVSQTQPAYLATVLGLPPTINIGAIAIAQVQVWSDPCILSLHDSASFQGSVTISSPNCGIASNSKASNAFAFTGNGGLNINAPSYSAGGCSQTSSAGTQCNNVTQGASPVPNPLSGLDSAMSLLTTSNFSAGQCPNNQPTAYETTPCYNGNSTLSGPLNGTYYFNGNVNLGNVTGTATLILFGNATLSKTTGNPTIQLTAETNPAVPPSSSLSSVSISSLMKDLLIYDPEPWSKKGVDVSGDSSSYLNGTVYVPNAPLTYGGNSSAGSPGCFQAIAYAVTFSGNTTLDVSKCKSDGAATAQVLMPSLVQ
jgi:hypothetical protein